MKIYPTNEGFNSAESQPISQSTTQPITFADFRSPNLMILPMVKGSVPAVRWLRIRFSSKLLISWVFKFIQSISTSS